MGHTSDGTVFVPLGVSASGGVSWWKPREWTTPSDPNGRSDSGVIPQEKSATLNKLRAYLSVPPHFVIGSQQQKTTEQRHHSSAATTRAFPQQFSAVSCSAAA